MGRLVHIAAQLLVLVGLSACAEIPKNRYGIERLKFRGMKELDHESLQACLATEQRDKVTLGLGAIISPSCGDPPFDKSRASLRLFALPWAPWPGYDEAIFKLDLDRLERWYQARGFYGVRVLDVEFEPTAARASDVCDGPDCTVDITVNIEEGEPIRIRKLIINVAGQVTPEIRLMIDKALRFKKGDRFDEVDYDQAREALAAVLREKGFARAKSEGEVVINRGLLVADIIFNVDTGPLCHFGDVRVESKGKVPEGPILAATLLSKGQLYKEGDIEDAQRSVYALGAFSSVTVRGELDKSDGPEIPVVVEVEPRRESLYMVGVGIMSGTTATGQAAEQNISIPQWDVHLLGSYENRNFFGGLRRFRIEERPRLLFLDQFPAVPDNSPRFGNNINARFTQPGVGDPRTNLFLEARWDNGPDPFLLFFRNDIGVALGLERGFFKQRLTTRVGVHQDVMVVSRRERQPIANDIRAKLNERYADEYAKNGMQEIIVRDRQSIFYDEPSSYVLPYLEQKVVLDLRDDSANPTKGFYFSATAHEAVRLGENMPGWNYLRLTPDVRGYAPLGLGIVLAGRFALGWLKVFSASDKLDDQSKILGAQSYRLRGGGANSNRGFTAGELGDGRTGGTHRWEASLELRIPLTKSLFLVAFGDMGDVNAGFDLVRTYSPLGEGSDPSVEEACERQEDQPVRTCQTMRNKSNDGFRFRHLNTAVGGGLRYHTPIGPVRLDVAGRPKALGWESDDNARMDLGFTKFRGAVQISIGEAF